jgi:hypothetical protein
MPFDAVTLTHLENALSDGFKYHNSLDDFILRSGVSRKELAALRAAAEQKSAQSGRFTKAPKRYVVREVLTMLSDQAAAGDRIVASMITNIVALPLADTSPDAITAVAALRAKVESDRRTQQDTRQRESEERRQAERSAERVKEQAYMTRQAARDKLRDRFTGLMAEGNAQTRGYLLETFLADLFEHEKLEPRGSFKLVGEQIDGSFQWRTRTSLLEAKWVKQPVAGADFGAFNYKIEGKSADTRGLFISINGYSMEAITGMNAKGALKFVCIDGAHIMRALVTETGLPAILERVWRHADETGEAYLPVTKL